MKRLAIGIALLLASTASAQTFDLGSNRLYEPLIGSNVLHNARAIGLGGAVTASVQDGSALWYNPAALARIPRLEISGDLIHDRLAGRTEALSLLPVFTPPAVTPAEADARHSRLGSAYLVAPVPTYRGALTVAAGVTVSNSLDRVLAGQFEFAPGTFVELLEDTPGYEITEEIGVFGFTEGAAGVLRAWQAGFGVDISPRVSVGASGVYFDGYMDFASTTDFDAVRIERDSTGANPPDTFDVHWTLGSTTRDEMSGWGITSGILFRPRNDLAVGAVIRSPIQITIDEDVLETYQLDYGDVSEYLDAPTTRTLQLPLSVTVGGAYLRGHFLFAGDFSYTDWTQSEYKDSPTLTQYNSRLAAAYREQISVGGGVEWVIPTSSTTLRAGLRWAQLPYHDKFVVDDQLTYSAGVGFLVDQVMAVDIGFSHSTARGGNPVYGFDEEYAATRVVLTLGYRL